MNYHSRLQRMEAKYLPRQAPFVRAMYEYGEDRRLAAVVISGRRFERLPGESKSGLTARVSEGMAMDPSQIIWRDIIDARDGKPYPWADDVPVAPAI